MAWQVQRAWMACCESGFSIELLGLQGLDIAVVKATTSAFHVAPKEKHVRTLKMAVYPGSQHRGTTYIITELISRLHQSTDWLVSALLVSQQQPFKAQPEPHIFEGLICALRRCHTVCTANIMCQ